MSEKFIIEKAIILSAGKGIRFWPLTATKPKPLLKILGKTIIEHNLEQLSGIVREVILIVGYKSKAIQEKIGNNYGRIKIEYVFQEKQIGTGDAAMLASEFVKDKFLLLNGDDIYFKEDIKNTLKKFPSICLKKVLNPENFGVVIKKDERITDFQEKPKKPKSNLVNTGLYFLPKEIFEYKLKKSKRGEYEFTDCVKEFIKEKKLNAAIAKRWIPLSFSWNMLDAIGPLLLQEKEKKEGIIEKGAQIKGKIILGEGSVVRGGSYIIGPVYIGKNCTIGPNCFIRNNVSIGNNCRIGQAVEIKNSIIGDNTNICHLSYVGDSIIGENCNLGAGTIVANLKHDKKTIKTLIAKSLVDTGRDKFGAVLGDDVKIGIGTLIYPGRKIGPHNFTLPGQKIERDIL